MNIASGADSSRPWNFVSACLRSVISRLNSMLRLRILLVLCKWAETNDTARDNNAKIRNHQVAHQGGVTVIARDFPSSFHTPSLLEPVTRKVYLPACKLV